MKTLFAFLVATGAVGWGIFGGEPVDLQPGCKMPAPYNEQCPQ